MIRRSDNGRRLDHPRPGQRDRDRPDGARLGPAAVPADHADLGPVTHQRGRPGAVLPQPRRRAAGAAPGLRAPAAADDRPLAAVGRRQGPAGGVGARVQGRLGLGHRPGELADGAPHAKRPADHAGRDDGVQPVARLRLGDHPADRRQAGPAAAVSDRAEAGAAAPRRLAGRERASRRCSRTVCGYAPRSAASRRTSFHWLLPNMPAPAMPSSASCLDLARLLGVAAGDRHVGQKAARPSCSHPARAWCVPARCSLVDGRNGHCGRSFSVGHGACIDPTKKDERL